MAVTVEGLQVRPGVKEDVAQHLRIGAVERPQEGGVNQTPVMSRRDHRAGAHGGKLTAAGGEGDEAVELFHVVEPGAVAGFDIGNSHIPW